MGRTELPGREQRIEFENWLRRREYTPRTVRDICCRLRRVRQTLGLSEIGRDTEGQITRENFPGCRSASVLSQLRRSVRLWNEYREEYPDAD